MIEIRVLPQPVFIEKTALGQHLSFDFLLRNSSDQDWLVQQVDLSVLDAGGHLVLRKSLNTNGIRPGIETLGIRTLEKGAQLCVYNPFHTLPAGVPCGRLRYEFHLTTESGEAIQTQVLVSAELYETKSGLCLPLAGRMIVHDGHDFYAHHRRVDLSHPFLAQNMGLKTNSGRYAYDFCPVNAAGDLLGGAGDSEKDWFGYGQAVLAPGHGQVIAAENHMLDNILGQRDFDFEQAIEAPNSIMGNYVLIDHRNGEFSLLAHLKQGSLLVEEGAAVEQGQELGRLGFSGSTGPWVHLHYELRTGIDLRVARGLPAYFRNFSRFRGQKQTKIERGHIDTGDIIESFA